MSDSLDLSLQRGSGSSQSNLVTPRTPKILASTRSDKEVGNELLTDISQRLDKLHIDGSPGVDGGRSVLVRPGDEGTAAATGTPSSSQVGSMTYTHDNQITTGRDMNMSSLHVTGNIQGTAKQSNKEITHSRSNDFNEEDDVAAGMLVPAPPPCILERDSQHDKIVAKLLSVPNTRAAILGMGGIGKTTLACSIASDSQIVDAYPRRLFLSFEGCSTPDLAYTNLATAFHVSADRRSSHRQILSQVLNYLKRDKTLVIIDNFEAFWEISANRRAADEFLNQLAILPQLAMIVTLRGVQRPGTVRWFKIEPLQTLTHDGSKELLSIITDEEYAEGDSEYIQKLLDAVAGIPLAVTLIGWLLRDETETPKSLWKQWTRESARAIRVSSAVDSDDRLYKLDISLRLSIFGARMNENAREVLAAISILPTGLNMDEDWLDRLRDLLTGRFSTTVQLLDCIRTLRDVALATLDSTTTPPRLRLLPPVREFCLSHMPLDGDLPRLLIDIYHTDVLEHADWALEENYVWVTTELSNLTAIHNHAITLCYVTDDFGLAIYDYTEWRRFLCMPETDVVESAIGILSDHPAARAMCLQAYGAMLSNFSRAREAISQLEQALSIHRELADKHEIGWDLYILGFTHYRLHDLASAERYLIEARDLYTETGHVGEKGSVLQFLADTYLEQHRLPEAECTAEEALELCRAYNKRREEINAIITMGRVYGEQGKYGLAVETLTYARDTSKVTHDTYVEAHANERLGLIHRDNKETNQAITHLQMAISLYDRAQRPDMVEMVRVSLEELQKSLNPPD